MRCKDCKAPTDKKINQEIKEADYLLVADKPIIKEVRDNKLFDNTRGGMLLNHILQHIGEERKFFKTKLILCKPKELKKSYINQCMSRFNKQFTQGDYKAIISMGKEATSYFMEMAKDEVDIEELRGRFYWSDTFQSYIIPTYHPVYVMNTPSHSRDLVNDINKATRIDQYPTEEELETKVIVLKNISRALKAIEFLNTQDFLSCDIETGGFNWRYDKIGELGISWTEGKAVIFTEELLEKKIIRDNLIQLFENEDITFSWQGGQFDVKFFRSQWETYVRIDNDTLLKHYTLDERKGTHALSETSAEFLNAPDYEDEFKEQIPKDEDGDLQYLEAPRDKLREYLGYDVDYPLRLDNIFNEIRDEDDKWLYDTILIPATNVLADIEMNGLKVDVEHITKLDKKYSEALEEKLQELQDLVVEAGFTPEGYKNGWGANSAPEAYNPNSWPQNRYLFFGILMLPKYKDYSTDKTCLKYWRKQLDVGDTRKLMNKAIEEARNTRKLLEVNKNKIGFVKNKVIETVRDKELLEEINPDLAGTKGYSEVQKYIKSLWKTELPIKIIDTLLEYRDLEKKHKTYVRGFLDRIWNDDGRVHTQFMLYGTETGRLSSKNPNIQNIPRDKELKNMVIAPEGKVLMECDYSQAELRTLAYFSQDDFLLDIYMNGKDLHDNVAEQLFGEDWDDKDRQKAKAVNFGLAYGLTPYGLYRNPNLDITIEEAEQIMEDWYANLNQAGEWIKNARNIPHRGEDTLTPLKRKRRFGLITDSNANFKENEAVNTLIQSTASDMTLLSTIRVHRKMEETGLAQVVNTVHDSILLEVPEENVDKVARIVVDIMEEVPKEFLDTKIPFKTDVEIGKSWGKLEEIELD